jgi:hypothetical protein
MTDTSIPATRFSESDFRVGRVFNRTSSVLSRNFLTFFVVCAVAGLPSLLLTKGSTPDPADPGKGLGVILIGVFVAIVLSLLSQAIVLYGAFQDMRGKPVSLSESVQVGLRRFFPILGLAICMSIGGMLASLLFIIPGLIVFTMWFVATPACVVEQLGPFRSMGRSSQLTKGHRWKIFGVMILLFIAAGIVTQLIDVILAAVGGSMLALIGDLIWNGVWGAFYAIFVVVTYHDLRVAKEGIDIEQIASVFD